MIKEPKRLYVPYVDYQKRCAELEAENKRLREALAESLELFKRQSVRSFVCGAAWWEFEKTGASMWASDRDKAWARAAERFPFVHVDHRENDDVLERYAALDTPAH